MLFIASALAIQRFMSQSHSQAFAYVASGEDKILLKGKRYFCLSNAAWQPSQMIPRVLARRAICVLRSAACIMQETLFGCLHGWMVRRETFRRSFPRSYTGWTGLQRPLSMRMRTLGGD